MEEQVVNTIDAIIHMVKERQEIDNIILSGLDELRGLVAGNVGGDVSNTGGAEVAEAGVPDTKAAAPAVVVTREDVRAVLARKAREGKTADVKALLKKHGAVNLTGVPESELAELLKEGEAL